MTKSMTIERCTTGIALNWQAATNLLQSTHHLGTKFIKLMAEQKIVAYWRSKLSQNSRSGDRLLAALDMLAPHDPKNEEFYSVLEQTYLRINANSVCLADYFILGLSRYIGFFEDHRGNQTSAIQNLLRDRIELSYAPTPYIRSTHITIHLGTPTNGPDCFKINSSGFSQNPTFFTSLYNHLISLIKKEKETPTDNLENILMSIAEWRRQFSIDSQEMLFCGRDETIALEELKTATLFGYRRTHRTSSFTTQLDWIMPLQGRYTHYQQPAQAHRAKYPQVDIRLPGTQRLVTLTQIIASPNGPALFYPSIEDSERIVHYVDNVLYKRLLEPNLDKALVIDTVAEIHWWMAHAMPYYRGSAAITDALTKVLLMKHDITPGKWKEGIIPDLEAFVLTREEFVTRYRSFFV